MAIKGVTPKIAWWLVKADCGTIDALSSANPAVLQDQVARKGGKIQHKVAVEIVQLAQERQGLLDQCRV